MAKILVGMSGGVDSAVTAYLLKAAGHEAVGITLRTWRNEYGTDSRCCEIDDAARTAEILGIPYYAINCTASFREKVVEPFMDDYFLGRTPNPCIGCNRDIKWEELIKAANTMGADYIATGHYASIDKTDTGRLAVKKADSAAKDQTYMLYRLSQEMLERTIMPLGKLTKERVREIARSAGIPVYDKPDSQEICFITEGDYGDFIERERNEASPPGDFVLEDGSIAGHHRGIIHYTVGQRRGLGIAANSRLFVKEIDAVNNRIILSEEKGLLKGKILINDIYYMGISELSENERLLTDVKIRYNHKGQEAFIKKISGDKAEITFKEPVKAAAPGQAAVCYDKEGRVLLGGTIM